MIRSRSIPSRFATVTFPLVFCVSKFWISALISVSNPTPPSPSPLLLRTGTPHKNLLLCQRDFSPETPVLERSVIELPSRTDYWSSALPFIFISTVYLRYFEADLIVVSDVFRLLV